MPPKTVPSTHSASASAPHPRRRPRTLWLRGDYAGQPPRGSGLVMVTLLLFVHPSHWRHTQPLCTANNKSVTNRHTMPKAVPVISGPGVP